MKRRFNGLEKHIINLLAIVFAVCFIWFIISTFIFSGKSVNIPVKNVAAYQIPYSVLMELKELSSKYSIDFAELLTIYSLENNFFPTKPVSPTKYELEQNIILNFDKIRSTYNKNDISAYYKVLADITSELNYFPIPRGYDTDKTVSYMYGDSWGAERSFDGSSNHQGTDILDRENVRGRIPIVSMTNGTLKDMDWNELGGYRIGIETENGTYYYYAHMDSYADNLEVGNRISAGQVIGFMGDSGYDKQEGVTGKFPVHLHVGISPKTTLANDFWINPYPFLRYIENSKVDYTIFSNNNRIEFR